MSQWSKLREQFVGIKREHRLPWYDRHIRELVLAGFKLATAEMETLYEQMMGEHGYELRQSTYPQISETKPNQYGLYAYGTHDRSEQIDDAITALAELHKSDIAADKAWLMPVLDDDEYVSWEFDIAVGTEQEVLETLRRAVPLMQAEINQQLERE